MDYFHMNTLTNNGDICFTVNNTQYSISDVNPKMSLNNWLRSEVCMTGTKWMCNEGGCGSCMVLIQYPSQKPISVNSCLVPIASVDGCNVYTIEAFGSRHDGFSLIQSRIASFGSTQCGYCTPGFVMSMHSLLEKNPSPSRQLIEDNFDGNICRCTGYRSILDAMKSFASDGEKTSQCGDIEDLLSMKCKGRKSVASSLRSFQISHLKSLWIRPMAFDELIAFRKIITPQYKFICGNTASGIYKSTTSYQCYFDLSQISDFKEITSSQDSVEFGASVTLSEICDYLNHHNKDSLTFQPISSHIKLIASHPIRNTASWAGNLMMKHEHRDFPSDVCTLLETCDATIKVFDFKSDSYATYPVYGSEGFMEIDMTNKVIVSVSLPKITSDSTHVKTFKITPRSQNAHAYVNAGFLAVLNDDKTSISQTRLVFGGLSGSFHRAYNVEEYLRGLPINSNLTLKDALVMLSNDVKSHCKDRFKINLALGLFYKFYLSLCDPSQLGPGVASGIGSLQRPISSGTQKYKTDPSTYPVSQHVPKFSGAVQSSGEAEFISDLPSSLVDLNCDVVLSSVGNAEIDSIDFTQARLVPGFVDVISRENFPSEVVNTYLYPYDPSQAIIAHDYLSHAGQVVAIVIAKSAHAARQASALVKVSYKNQKKPLLTVQDAVKEKSIYQLFIPDFVTGDPDQAITAAPHVVSGEYNFGHQYHFYMETMVCKAQRTDHSGFKIESSTQSQTDVQNAISHMFAIPVSRVEVTTKRIGGAFGGKASNSFLPSCIAALASHVTKRPVTFHATLETCMRMLGTRTPFTVKYKLGFDSDGKLLGVDTDVYTNSGCSSFDGEADDDSLYESYGDGVFFCENRRFRKNMVKTNLPSSTWCRAPGSLQLTAAVDLMIEHVAFYLKKDPISVKLTNLYQPGQRHLNGYSSQKSDIRVMYADFLKKYKVVERKNSVESFNQNNRWKKKGLAVTPMKYFVSMWAKYGVLVSIYANDGSVVVSHGGIDSGQGINVKVIQAVAYKLGIPLELVTVQRTDTITSANSSPTGGSICSESVCRSALECCQILNDRIQPIKAEMKPDSTWLQIVSRCFSQGVHLSACCMSAPKSESGYPVYGVTAAEVEYDVITGERQILQVDTMFDCGVSINPSVDIGQVEGAFVMGLGFWLTEKMVYDETTGQLLTAGTWDYKPPVSKDIPINWNIELLPDAPNPVGVLRSKASGEAPMCMSICVAHALKKAVDASREERGITDFFTLPLPATVDSLHNSLLIQPINDFLLF